MNDKQEALTEECKKNITYTFPCNHYKRRCLIKVNCCDGSSTNIYSCRICHDEKNTHKLEPNHVEELQCILCHTFQEVSDKCINCGTKFGNYSCIPCRLFDDCDKKQFHCEGCGICRIGGRENFFHDDKCGMCYRKGTKHQCIENIGKTTCPVCLEDLHTSTIPCIVNKCGHLIHETCYEEMGNNFDYKCPICRKTIHEYIAKFLKDEIATTQMPPELSNLKVNVQCNDCSHTFEAIFHIVGYTCPECDSFNTSQI